MGTVVSMSPVPAPLLEQWIVSQLGNPDLKVAGVHEADEATRHAALVDAEIVLGDYTFQHRIDEALLEHAPKLKFVQQPSVGYQHIDLDATREAGIPVANVGAANAIGVAEQAIMFMLCLLKRALYFHAKTARGEWGQQDVFSLGMLELHGKTLGIVGMGHIGREVAARAKAFGCRIAYHDLVALPAEEEKALGAERMELDDLLRAADIVSLHVPLTPETTRLIDAERLGLMKPEAYLLNLARGEVVDEAALAEALEEGRLAGAGIDVFAQEPVDPGNPLLASDKVILSPHVAGGTNESRVRMITVTIENVTRALTGEKPLYVVNGVEMAGTAR